MQIESQSLMCGEMIVRLTKTVDKAPHQCKSCSTECQRVCGRRTKANILEEVGAVVCKADTAKNLSSETDTSNLRTTKLEVLFC